MRTLDSVADRLYGETPVDFLKLDVQGYELEVLGGASRILSTCEFVLLECSLIRGNLGAPLFHDVVAAMAGYGFLLYDIATLMRRSDNRLSQIDGLFVSASSAWRPHAAGTVLGSGGTAEADAPRSMVTGEKT